MSDDDDVKRVLLECFPDECDAVGPSALNDTITGRASFDHPLRGRAFPLHEILAELASAVVVIRAIIDVVPPLHNKLGRKPKVSEIKQEIAKREGELKGVGSEQQDKIIEKVIK